MQQDKFLNKDKTQAILDTRPAGVPINEALNALAKQGYTIEGYNDVSLGEKAINVVGDVAKAAASDLVVRPVSRTTEAVTRTLFPDSMAAKGYESYADENKPVQTGVFGIEAPQPGTGTQAIRNIAGETAQTAAYLIPYGKVAGGIAGATGSKFLGQLGAGSAGGYLADVGMGLQDEQQTVKEALTPGVGTAIGAAIPTGFAGAQVAGRALQKTGAGLAGSVLPVNEREAGIIKSYLADKPFMQRVADVLKGTDSAPVTSGSTAVGQSLFGTKKMIGVQAERAQKTLWNDLIKPQLDNAKVQIDLPEYFNTVEKKIIEDTPELTRQKALLEALNSFKEDYAGMNTISLAKLQKLKEGWAEFVPEKFYKGQNIAGNARQVSALLADEARKTIYDVLGPEVKQAYFDYGNLMNLSKMGQTAMTGQKLKGGTGGLVSELISKAVTPVGTVGGNVIYKVGQGLEFIGKAGAKTLDEVLGLNNNQVLNNPINQQTTQSTANATKNVIMKDTIPQTGNSARLITKESYDQTLKEFKKNLGNMNSGIDPVQLGRAVKLATYHIQEGVISATELATRLAQDGIKLAKKQFDEIYSKAVQNAKISDDQYQIFNKYKNNPTQANMLEARATAQELGLEDSFILKKEGFMDWVNSVTSNKEAKMDLSLPMRQGKQGIKSIPKELQPLAEEAPKTVKVYIKSKFSNKGIYKDVPVIRKVINKTLYQGGSEEGRQFWTSDKKYAEQFGKVIEKSGDFYQVDNGNRVIDVYVETPNK